MEFSTVGAGMSVTLLLALGMFFYCWVAISSFGVRTFALPYCILFVKFGCCLL